MNSKKCIYRFYKPCGFIHVDKQGKMWITMGSNDIIQGRSKFMKNMQRLFNKIEMKIFHLNCKENPNLFIKNITKIWKKFYNNINK